MTGNQNLRNLLTKSGNLAGVPAHGATSLSIVGSILRTEPEAIARGVAIALFTAFLPIPLHTMLGAAACVLLRANLPIMLVLVWINNPLTFLPICLFNFQIGQLLLGEPTDTSQILNNGIGHLFENINGTVFLELITPLMVGSVAIGTVLAIAGYSLTRLAGVFISHRVRSV